jgi:hypothetical protein
MEIDGWLALDLWPSGCLWGLGASAYVGRCPFLGTEWHSCELWVHSVEPKDLHNLREASLATYHLRLFLDTTNRLFPLRAVHASSAPCKDLPEEENGTVSEDKRRIVQSVAQIWRSFSQVDLGISIILFAFALVSSVRANVGYVSPIPRLGTHCSFVLFTSGQSSYICHTN